MNKDGLILLLVTIMIGALLFVTWADVAISTWIVGHSGVEDMMKRDGKETALFLKDAFFHLKPGIYLAEIVPGGTLLWLLWRRLCGGSK